MRKLFIFLAIGLATVGCKARQYGEQTNTEAVSSQRYWEDLDQGFFSLELKQKDAEPGARPVYFFNMKLFKQSNDNKLQEVESLNPFEFSYASVPQNQNAAHFTLITDAEKFLLGKSNLFDDVFVKEEGVFFDLEVPVAGNGKKSGLVYMISHLPMVNVDDILKKASKQPHVQNFQNDPALKAFLEKATVQKCALTKSSFQKDIYSPGIFKGIRTLLRGSFVDLDPLPAGAFDQKEFSAIVSQCSTDFKDVPIAAFLKKMEVFAEHAHLKIAAKAQQILKDAASKSAQKPSVVTIVSEAGETADLKDEQIENAILLSPVWKNLNAMSAKSKLSEYTVECENVLVGLFNDSKKKNCLFIITSILIGQTLQDADYKKVIGILNMDSSARMRTINILRGLNLLPFESARYAVKSGSPLPITLNNVEEIRSHILRWYRAVPLAHRVHQISQKVLDLSVRIEWNKNLKVFWSDAAGDMKVFSDINVPLQTKLKVADVTLQNFTIRGQNLSQLRNKTVGFTGSTFLETEIEPMTNEHGVNFTAVKFFIMANVNQDSKQKITFIGKIILPDFVALEMLKDGWDTDFANKFLLPAASAINKNAFIGSVVKYIDQNPTSDLLRHMDILLNKTQN